MTLEELELLEQEEHDHTLEVIAALLALFASLHASVADSLTLWFAKYADNGNLDWQNARRKLADDELAVFNSKYGTEFVRLTRMDSFLMGLGFDLDIFTHIYIDRVSELASWIFDKELSFFDVDIDTAFDTLMKTRWGADEAWFSERITGNHDKFLNTLRLDFKRALLSGEDLETVLDTFQQRFDVAMRNAKRLVLTESPALSSTIRQKIYRELGVKKYRFVATLDERTSDICRHMNGLVFPISAYEVGVTAPPMHPHCRSVTVPVYG